MDPTVALIAAAAGYLLGSISVARIVIKIAAPDVDLGKTEIQVPSSGEKLHLSFASATTVSMQTNPRLGFLTFVLDLLKVAIPTLVFKRLYPGTSYHLIVATAGMAGHVWPLYHGFKGGGGQSSIFGAMLVIDWVGVLATAVGGMMLGLFVVRNVWVAYVAGMWFLIPWLWFRTHDIGHVLYAVVVNVIYVSAMLPEVKLFLRYRHEGEMYDYLEVMQRTGMGRGISKIAKRFGLIKDQPRRGDG